jgi:hypothetical protein
MVAARLVSTGVAMLMATVAFAAGTPPEKRELTPADAMATTRVFENSLTLNERVDSGTTSPDGRRYLLRLAHGDVERNGVWTDLLTGSLESLDAAAHPKPCAHLFTTGFGSNKIEFAGETDPTSTNLIQWINNTEVAFLWSDAHATRQVMSVNMLSCKQHFLTHSPTDVLSFLFAPDGTLIFNAQLPRTTGASKRLWTQGFVVSDTSDGWSIMRGQIDGAEANSVLDNTWFIRSPSVTSPSTAPLTRAIAILGKHTDRTSPIFRDLFLNHSGKLALVDVGLDGIPAGWHRYTNPSLQSLLEIEPSIPGRLPLRYAIVDLKTGASRILWDAPRHYRGQVAWAPHSDTLLLAPTYLPLSADTTSGLSGTAAASLDVHTGQYQLLPLDLTARTVAGTEWLTDTTVEIRSTNDSGTDSRIDRLTFENDHWKVTAPDTLDHLTRPAIHIDIRQSLNRPPQVFAVNSATGDSRLVLDPNPHLLEQFKLGRVERMSGRLPNGRQWIGQLIYPADYTPGTRYPVVLQSYYGHAMGPEDFSLDGTWGFPGMGLGPSSYGSYPGQLLATRNIAVLTLLVVHPAPGPGEDDDYQLAFESLSKQLIASGIADPDKIALAGFSRNGHWVEFTLAHSTFPFASAIAADNYDPSYFQSALVNWRSEEALLNGAPAFGEGLQKWLARAVGFNAEHIHAPLLMIGQSGGTALIIAQWEILSRLRHLQKPVEMYMMPEVDTHPAHVPQNPRQIMAVQTHAIDWLSFWLTGHEDPSPSKAEQYRRWHAFQRSHTVPDP